MWPFTSSSPYDGLLRTIDEVATPLVNPSSSVENAKEIREYDYIIIGGGTSGCVLARRLSENPDISVLVLERGDISASWMSSVPLLAIPPLYDNKKIPYVDKWFGGWEEGSAYDKDVDFSKLPSSNSSAYPPSREATTPLKTTRTSRQIPLLAGRALGGSTKINSQLYTRPFAGELDSWANSCGDPSWNYENMKELMKRSENHIAASIDEREYRGRDGPWLTRKFDKIYFKSCENAIKACQAIGIPFVTQCNHPSGPAACIFDVERTMGEGGWRITTFDAFLPPEVLRERRLIVCTGVVASSIDIRGDKDGISAKGVFLEPASNNKTRAKKYYVAAKREVILCGGALVSPQLLMLSGIGPKKHLERMGIPVVKDLPGVGAHLQDHPPVSLVYTIPLPDSVLILQKKPLRLLIEALKYLLFKTGLFMFPVPQFLLFMRSALLHDNKEGTSSGLGDIQFQTEADSSQLDTRISENVPDIELECLPGPAVLFPLPIPKDRGCYTLFCLSLQPHSLGFVELSSRSPHDRPKCTLGLFTHPNDLVVMRKAVRLAARIAKTMKEQGYDIEPLWTPHSENDEDLDEFIRFEPRANFHFSSTCRMAPESTNSSVEDNVNAAGVGKTPGVVDSQLRVYGIHGLRIADASIFPTVPACHLQAPVVLVAEKCAEIIKNTWV